MKEGYKVANAVSDTKFKAGDKVKCINNTLVEQWFSVGETYTVAVAYSDNEHIGFIHTGFAVWHSDRFELIEKEEIMQESNEVTNAKKKQFNPKPGDKIICNNGEEFTCCTKEFLLSKGIVLFDRGYEIHAYRADPHNEYAGFTWMGWSDGGKYIKNKEWDIREVIPKDSTEKDGYIKYEGEVVSTWGGGVDIVYPPTYTKEDIRKAWVDFGRSNEALEIFMKSLNKVTSSEYKEYLRLKAVFEQENE